eukprot:19933-Chlamydomonas_euryale.AAC.3
MPTVHRPPPSSASPTISHPHSRALRTNGTRHAAAHHARHRLDTQIAAQLRLVERSNVCVCDVERVRHVLWQRGIRQVLQKGEGPWREWARKVRGRGQKICQVKRPRLEVGQEGAG